jgi:hypothetical protein
MECGRILRKFELHEFEIVQNFINKVSLYDRNFKQGETEQLKLVARQMIGRVSAHQDILRGREGGLGWVGRKDKLCS